MSTGALDAPAERMRIAPPTRILPARSGRILLTFRRSGRQPGRSPDGGAERFRRRCAAGIRLPRPGWPRPLSRRVPRLPAPASPDHAPRRRGRYLRPDSRDRDRRARRGRRPPCAFGAVRGSRVAPGLRRAFLPCRFRRRRRPSTTLVSNAGQSESSVSSSDSQAQSFGTGPNAGGYTITEVQIRLSDLAFVTTTIVQIREDDGSKPGDLVATLTNPATLTSNALNTFTAPTNTTLDASTTYWISVNEGISSRAAFPANRSRQTDGRDGLEYRQLPAMENIRVGQLELFDIRSSHGHQGRGQRKHHQPHRDAGVARLRCREDPALPVRPQAYGSRRHPVPGHARSRLSA